MALRANKTETESDEVRLPAGVVLKPPVSVEDLKTDTEHDPESADEFVALIRALRRGRLPARRILNERHDPGRQWWIRTLFPFCSGLILSLRHIRPFSQAGHWRFR
jgi:hypothetical protein